MIRYSCNQNTSSEMDRPRKHRHQGREGMLSPRYEAPSNHALQKRLVELKHEEQISSIDHVQRQKAVHRDLMNIRAAKAQRKGSTKNRGVSGIERDENSIQNMIEKFRKRRIEQTMVNDLLRQRRESLVKIEEDMRRRSPSKLWDSVTESRADTLRIAHARKSHDNIIDDMRRCLNDSEQLHSAKDEVTDYIGNNDAIEKFVDLPETIFERRMSNSRPNAGVLRKRSIENDILPVRIEKERKRSVEKVDPNVIKGPRRTSKEFIKPEGKTSGFFQRRKSLQIERERPLDRRNSRSKVTIEDQTEIQALKNIERELPIYAISRPPPVYLTEKYAKKKKDVNPKVVMTRESAFDFSNIVDKRPENKPCNYNDTLNKIRGGGELTENGRKYLKKKTMQQPIEDKIHGEIEPLEREYTCKWSLVSDLSSDGKSLEEETWDDVRRCKYLRGYDPPEMIMPKEEVNIFVFGRNENDLIEMKRAERKRSVSSAGESIPEEICVRA